MQYSNSVHGSSVFCALFGIASFLPFFPAAVAACPSPARCVCDLQVVVFMCVSVWGLWIVWYIRIMRVWMCDCVQVCSSVRPCLFLLRFFVIDLGLFRCRWLLSIWIFVRVLFVVCYQFVLSEVLVGEWKRMTSVRFGIVPRGKSSHKRGMPTWFNVPWSRIVPPVPWVVSWHGDAWIRACRVSFHHLHRFPGAVFEWVLAFC